MSPLSPAEKAAWTYLVIAGLLETGWVVGLKYTDGFTRLTPSVLTVVAISASMFFLGLALRALPVGTAYAMWVGIGTVGAAALGILLFNESREPLRIAFLALLVLALVGLRLTTSTTRQ